MKKLKKTAVFLLFAAVLLSCLPEPVQAADVVQLKDLTGESEHGEPVIDNDAARACMGSTTRIEYDTDELSHNIYLATPHNYCVVDFPSGKEYESGHYTYIIFIDPKGTPWDLYEVRNGKYAQGTNQSRTVMSGGGHTYEVEGQSLTLSYVVHFGMFSTDNWPAPVYQPPVIHMPSRYESLTDEAIYYLLGCLSSGDMGDCSVTAGGSDNPDVYEPGGLPGSEDNPVLDEEIGTPVVRGREDAPDVKGNISGNNLEYYDVIEWKKKTSTGYNLLDSGHAVCRIQFKIEPKATFLEGGKSTVLEAESKDFSLGFCNASQLEKKFQYHDLVSKFYGKFMAEHHPGTNAQSYELYTEFNYYCRVVVSDSLTVIPNQSSGWKCGKWKRLVISGNYQNKDKVSDSGDFNEDGEWESDGDYENVDDGKTETNDPANADKDDVEKNGKYDTQDVKSLLDDVSHFPKIVKKIFSFLPGWCLRLFAFSFACMCLILVIKAVRG